MTEHHVRGDTITFDKAKLRKLKAAYGQAVAEGVEVFDFDGRKRAYSVGYAKYLIEYLEGLFK